MASTCEHTHGASAPRPRRAAVRAGSHHAPASAAISASAWPPRRRPQLVTSLKRRPTKISEQNRNSEYEMHHPADAKNALTKPLALISFCYCFVSRFRQGRFFRAYHHHHHKKMRPPLRVTGPWPTRRGRRRSRSTSSRRRPAAPPRSPRCLRLPPHRRPTGSLRLGW